MSLYSELGVKEDASREEIRAAYLRLAKENHPDLMPNDRQRELAEERMSRLNYVMEVLGQDEKRRQYDSELWRQKADAEAAIQEALAVQAWEAERGAWGSGWSAKPARIWLAAAALVLIGTGAAFFWTNEGAEWRSARTAYTPLGQPVPDSNSNFQASGGTKPADRKSSNRSFATSDRTTLSPAQKSVIAQSREQSPGAGGQPAADRSTELAGGRRDSGELLREARNALRESPKSIDPASSAPEAASKPATAVAEPGGSNDARTPAPITPAVSDATPRKEIPLITPGKSEASSWKGVWRYAPNPGSVLAGQFAPQSIEMHLEETGQNVRGQYKARYEVTGKYDGNVEFSLTGQAEGSERVRGEWTGPAGARGEFELKKTAVGILQMSWWTTTFGKKKALVSGVARLVEHVQ